MVVKLRMNPIMGECTDNFHSTWLQAECKTEHILTLLILFLGSQTLILELQIGLAK